MPVKKVLTAERVPVKIWTTDVEPEAEQQLLNTARLPFVFKHVAAMPDVHFGKGATVGSVIATKGAICPAAVGVDIGCGMIAVPLSVTEQQAKDNLDKIYKSILRSVPVGYEGNHKITDSVQNWIGWQDWDRLTAPVKDRLKNTTSQLGSLGGGNHFIELCLDQSNCVWIMLHSGSRNIGKTMAERHIDKAKGLMKQMFIDLPDPDLSYFVEQTAEFDAYMHDLEWCQNYAMQNRLEMLERVKKSISYAVFGELQEIAHGLSINCHHNYVSRENHFDTNVLITRKGAIRARTNDYGIIPGSMGTNSYIVRGLGNTDSFCSCSHGAGRSMSRTKARKTFTKEDLQKQTEGVLCRKDEGVLDEIPSSYKDINTVMENSSDLVETVAILKQFMCIKG
jgi:tRNA-splicing ligase RtcB